MRTPVTRISITVLERSRYLSLSFVLNPADGAGTHSPPHRPRGRGRERGSVPLPPSRGLRGDKACARSLFSLSLSFSFRFSISPPPPRRPHLTDLAPRTPPPLRGMRRPLANTAALKKGGEGEEQLQFLPPSVRPSSVLRRLGFESSLASPPPPLRRPRGGDGGEGEL